MTTIAFDGKELVSDSQLTQGDVVCLSPFKKIYTPEEGEYWEVNGVKAVAFGLAGNADAIEYIKEKLREGITHRTRFDHEDLGFNAILIDENGLSYDWIGRADQKNNRHRNHLIPILPPLAVGTGEHFALAAMAIGKSARKAVEVAIRLDCNSSGDLQIWTFPGKPAVPSVRPVKPTPEVVVKSEQEPVVVPVA